MNYIGNISSSLVCFLQFGELLNNHAEVLDVLADGLELVHGVVLPLDIVVEVVPLHAVQVKVLLVVQLRVVVQH